MASDSLPIPAAAAAPAAALGPAIAMGVVGAGAMGAGIAQVAALAGHTVHLFDTRSGAAQTAIDGIVAMLAKLVAKGKLTQDKAAAAHTAMHAAESLPDLAPCGLVVEAIVENLEAKRELFRSLERVVSLDALLATNTSSISVTAIGAALEHPGRLAGMHFFNPAPLMPLVEIISGAATTCDTAATLHATAARWGKDPVYARSTPGFIVNRVARPYYAEALRVLNEGGSDPATLDALLREAGGFRMGPFELMDLIGHDVNYAVTRSVFDAFYGDPRFTPSLVQLELVEAGFLGRKSGRGFFHYGDGAPAPTPQSASANPPPASVRLHDNSSLTTSLAQRLRSAAVKIDQAGGGPDGRTATLPTCVLYETDGRTATARAIANNEPDTVLVDLTLDPNTATRLAIAAADTASSAALAEATGLLQAAGYQVSTLDDVPGLIVARTVAMLANEAADAVHQRVCSAGDCDLAMRKGVNYPRGPLEWADTLGAAHVAALLDNLANTYGDPRYRVSPLLRRKALTGGRFHPDSRTPPVHPETQKEHRDA